MKKVFRRLFPSRPVLGVTLLILIGIEAGAIAQTVVGQGKANEGAWYLPPTPIANNCIYTHGDDTATNITNGAYIWKYLNYHHSICTVAVPAGTTACVQQQPLPSSCKEAADQSHLTNQN